MLRLGSSICTAVLARVQVTKALRKAVLYIWARAMHRHSIKVLPWEGSSPDQDASRVADVRDSIRSVNGGAPMAECYLKHGCRHQGCIESVWPICLRTDLIFRKVAKTSWSWPHPTRREMHNMRLQYWPRRGIRKGPLERAKAVQPGLNLVRSPGSKPAVGPGGRDLRNLGRGSSGTDVSCHESRASLERE